MSFKQLLPCCLSLALGLSAVLFNSGCHSTDASANGSSGPWLPPSMRSNVTEVKGVAAAGPEIKVADPVNAMVMLRPGEPIKVIYSDIPPPGWPPTEVRVGEDGKITLPLSVTVVAAGKTPNQLQEEIRTNYVPRYLKHLTLTVKTEERFYFVGGDVRFPNRFQYFGHITVLRAIDTAGGFGEFADKSSIDLRRADGRVIKINGKKAMRNPKLLDLEVFPGDQIFVNRRSI